ncbi:laccase 2 precursor [Collybia nuda]|uniref:Laccase 2 n=1 Tax=Collybia nuda TaxID=64659 RepID=A0A9P5YFA3_9AGAR|nr:laccase 2 precursor [Collybia nuda]
MFFLSSLVIVPFLSSVYSAADFKSDLHVVNRDISPDGFSRSAVLVGSRSNNAAFPGPVIKGFKGSRFLLDVVDSLTDNTMPRATSIHWHGIVQEGTAWADGVSGVTQCPISPGHSFLYDFKVPNQAGTFWYHSHLLAQYCDGLRGAFIVYDRLDPYRYKYDIDDESTIITLADWYHAPSPTKNIRSLPDSILINGKGRYAGGPASPLAVVNIIRKKRYRFRLIAMSCDADYVFSIDGHTMTIIETDGVNVQPETVDEIHIYAGQRYSFVLTANQPIGNYWIRANPNKGNVGFEGGLNSAILRYRTAPLTDPTTTQANSTAPLLETNLHPLHSPGAPGLPMPGGADVALNLVLTLDIPTLTFAVNGARFEPPTVPILLQILSGAQAAQDLLPTGSVYTLPRNKVIEISIPGGINGSPHPFHLHGHSFDVVRSAGSSVYNYVNPVRRDVVSTGLAGDNVTIRFVTDNAGPWILHCHIDWHLRAGMSVVLAEDTGSVAKQKHPAAWDQLCPVYNALTPDQL